MSNRLVVSCLQVPLLDKQKAFGKDLNLVFWTDNQRKINPDLIEGKCYLRSQQSIQNSNETVESWTKAGEYRFYFNQYYNKEAKEITGDLPYKAENYGATVSKGKGGKGKGKIEKILKGSLDLIHLTFRENSNYGGESLLEM